MIMNYNSYHLDGQTSYHGLMLYVHHSIKLHDISKYSGENVEAIKIIISKKQHEICCCRPVQITKSLHDRVNLFYGKILHNYHQLPLTVIGDLSLDVGDGRNRSFCDMMRKSTTVTSM